MPTTGREESEGSQVPLEKVLSDLNICQSPEKLDGSDSESLSPNSNSDSQKMSHRPVEPSARSQVPLRPDPQALRKRQSPIKSTGKAHGPGSGSMKDGKSSLRNNVAAPESGKAGAPLHQERPKKRQAEDEDGGTPPPSKKLKKKRNK